MYNPSHTTNSNTDLEGAKAVARRIFESYDRDRNGVIDSVETVPMIVDAYKSFNRVFTPTRGDIESYSKVMDRNGDGRVTYQDIEELCIKYLCPQYATKQRPQDRLQSQDNIQIAKKIFNKYDTDQSGYLPSNQIQKIVQETYQAMGLQQYQPSQQEVQQFIAKSDHNNDGLLSLKDFESLVIHTLNKAA